MFVYKLYNKDDALLYVGVTNNTHKRLGEHSRMSVWWSEVVPSKTDILELDTRRQALQEEFELIKSESPKYNKVNYAPKDYKLEKNSFTHIERQRIELSAIYGGVSLVLKIKPCMEI